MSSAADQDVYVHLSCCRSEHFCVSERDDLVSVDDADPEWSVCEDHRGREGGRRLILARVIRVAGRQWRGGAARGGGPASQVKGRPDCAVGGKEREKETHVIAVTSYASDVWCDAPKVVPRVRVCRVAGRDDLGNLSGDEEFFKLGWQVGRPVRDVQVTDDEDEHGGVA